MALQCYELLTIQYLEQSQDEETWELLHCWHQAQLSTVQVAVNLSKELWFIVVFLRENPDRLHEFLNKSQSIHGNHPRLLVEEEDLLVNYLQSFKLTELYLDTTFRSSNLDFDSVSNNGATTHIGHNLPFKIPNAIFRCPGVKVLSLKNNNLDHLSPDIGRLGKLQKLFLTNNRLQNGSIPYTLAFCRQLQELYLDDNLLDALPSVLLRIPSLTTVHRHGNHNYFKSTFMWYHTDVTGRILPTTTNSEEGERPEQPSLVNLQNIAAKVIIASRINFYAAEIPFRLKNYISDMVDTVNLCENCRTVKKTSAAGFKVFTFRNPYLGNTCVPFLHWACNYNCAKAIEIPARREQILSALEQDRLYQEYVQRSSTMDASGSRSSRSTSSVSSAATNRSLSLSHVNLPTATAASVPEEELPSSHSCFII